MASDESDKGDEERPDEGRPDEEKKKKKKEMRFANNLRNKPSEKPSEPSPPTKPKRTGRTKPNRKEPEEKPSENPLESSSSTTAANTEPQEEANGAATSAAQEPELLDLVKMMLRTRYENEVLVPSYFGTVIPDCDPRLDHHVHCNTRKSKKFKDERMELRDLFSPPKHKKKLIKKLRKMLHLKRRRPSGQSGQHQRHPGLRILVEGQPGSGKSNLALRMCRDWSRGSEEYVAKFDLVVLAPLALLTHNEDFGGEDSLEALIVSLIRVDGYDDDDDCFVKLIESSNILLVLDGYDKAKHERLILPLVKREQYSEMTVVVTSRPNCGPVDEKETSERQRGDSFTDGSFTEDDDKDDDDEDDQEEIANDNLLDYFDKRVVVRGIADNHTSKCLSAFMASSSSERVERVKATLTDLLLPLECPAFLAMTGSLAEAEDMLMSKRTQVYRGLFRLLVASALDTDRDDVDLFDWDPEEPSVEASFLARFGRLALNVLVAERADASFTKTEILDECSDDEAVLRLGLLVPDFRLVAVGGKKQHQEETYKPVHPSLLHFAAAFHVWYWSRDKTEAELGAKIQTLQSFLPEPEGPTKTTQSPPPLLFPFLLGLMEDKATGFGALRHLQYKHRDWFDTHFDALWLRDEEVTPELVSALVPFIPSVWKVSCTPFAASPLHRAVLSRGLADGRIKEIRLDMDADAALPEAAERGGDEDCAVEVPTLTLNAAAQMSESVRLFCETVECEDLWCRVGRRKLPHRELFHLIPSVRFARLSLLGMHSNASEFLPLLHREVVQGRLMNVRLHMIECTLARDKRVLLDLLADLVRLEKVEGVRVRISESDLSSSFVAVAPPPPASPASVAPTSKQKHKRGLKKHKEHDYVSFEGWRLFFQRVSESHLITQLSVMNMNVESSSYRADLNLICHSGRKSMRAVELNGDIEVELGPEEERAVGGDGDGGRAEAVQPVLDIDYLHVDAMPSFWSQVGSCRVSALYFEGEFPDLNEVSSDFPTLGSVRQLRLSLARSLFDGDAFLQLQLLSNLEVLALDLTVFSADNERSFREWVQQIVSVLERAFRLKRVEIGKVEWNYEFGLSLVRGIAKWLTNKGSRKSFLTSPQIPLESISLQANVVPAKILDYLSIAHELKAALSLHLVDALSLTYPSVFHLVCADGSAGFYDWCLSQLAERFPPTDGYKIELNPVEEEPSPWKRRQFEAEPNFTFCITTDSATPS